MLCFSEKNGQGGHEQQQHNFLDKFKSLNRFVIVLFAKPQSGPRFDGASKLYTQAWPTPNAPDFIFYIILLYKLLYFFHSGIYLLQWEGGYD